MTLLLAGLNHKTARVSVREKLSLSVSELPGALEKVRAIHHVREVVILSTCNRTEVYTATDAAKENGVLSYFQEFCRLPLSDLAPNLYTKSDREAAHHLFLVAGGLDSMILGENQILGQVKQAFQIAQKERSIGTFLHRLFQSALEAGKRIRSETALGKNPGSVGEAAVELARHIFGTLQDKTVLLVGIGKMGNHVLEALLKNGISRLLLCNRTPKTARQAAEKFHGIAYPLEEVQKPLGAADIVITSTGSSTPLLTKLQLDSVMRERRYAPLFVIDIAVPRDVEETAGQIENLFLYNIDDLNRIVETYNRGAQKEAGRARLILEEELAKFQAWRESLEIVPTIKALTEKIEKLKSEELEKILSKNRNVTPEERSLLENLAHNLVNKMLHIPRIQLKNYASHPLRFDYLEVARNLFGLNEIQKGGK